jgi:hypothetical protein
MTQSTLTSRRTEIDAAIRQTAQDYFAGWNEGDPARIGRSLHPDLAKRIVRPGDSPSSSWPPGDRLDEMSAMRLMQLAQHDPEPEYGKWAEVVILDRFEKAASLKIGGDTGIDTRKWGGEYDHLVAWNGRWVILHVHWGLRPTGPDDLNEDAAITNTALEYVESYYERDGPRMERSLHPQLVRRIVIPNSAPSSHVVPGDYLYQMSAQSLVRFVAERGVPVPVHERRAEVTILDRVANAASVRVDASTWIEYLHLCKWNARWVIIDSLWVKPAAP